MAKNPSENYQPGPDPTQNSKVKRDPEDRKVRNDDRDAVKEKNLDKTLADSFPTSDPPSSIPDPAEEDAA